MIEGFIHYVEHSIVPGVGTLTAEFRERNEAIGAVVSAKAEAVQQECTSARHAIDAAAQTVQREADALGLKRKP